MLITTNSVMLDMTGVFT